MFGRCGLAPEIPTREGANPDVPHEVSMTVLQHTAMSAANRFAANEPSYLERPDARTLRVSFLFKERRES